MIEEWDWNSASVMVMHSDGLSSNWSRDEFALRDSSSVTDTANELLQTLSKRDDDAAVLVIRGTDQ